MALDVGPEKDEEAARFDERNFSGVSDERFVRDPLEHDFGISKDS